MKKTITIEDAREKRSGTTNGRAWTLYEVTDAEGTKYGTFDGRYLTMVGARVQVDVERNAKGYWNIVDKPMFRGENVVAKAEARVRAPDDMGERLDKVVEGLRAIYRLLEKRLPENKLPEL